MSLNDTLHTHIAQNDPEYLEITRQLSNVGLTPGHRLRRWPSIKPAMGPCLLACSAPTVSDNI